MVKNTETVTRVKKHYCYSSNILPGTSPLSKIHLNQEMISSSIIHYMVNCHEIPVRTLLFFLASARGSRKVFHFFFFRFISLIAGLSCLVFDLSNRIQFTSLSELAYCFISSTRESFSWVNCLTWSSSSSSSSSWSTVLGTPPLNVYSINFRRKRSNYERKHGNSIESRCSVKKLFKTR